MKSTRPISDIKKGKRVRKDQGDIDALAKSIEDLGLLQPIGIRPDGSLVCGGRRLLAFEKLKREMIPVYVCRNLKSELDYLLAERDENTCRENLIPSEARAMADRLRPMFEADARQAQIDAGNRGKEGGRGKKKTLSSTCTKGLRDNTKRSATQAARAAGYSESTLKKVREVEFDGLVV